MFGSGDQPHPPPPSLASPWMPAPNTAGPEPAMLLEHAPSSLGPKSLVLEGTPHACHLLVDIISSHLPH